MSHVDVYSSGALRLPAASGALHGADALGVEEVQRGGGTRGGWREEGFLVLWGMAPGVWCA